MDDLIEAIARKIQSYTGEYSEEIVRDIHNPRTLVKDWELYKPDAREIIDMIISNKHTYLCSQGCREYNPICPYCLNQSHEELRTQHSETADVLRSLGEFFLKQPPSDSGIIKALESVGNPTQNCLHPTTSFSGICFGCGAYTRDKPIKTS